MDAIVQWITQIIIFMLLATIVELLIPATSMKKYIKLVIALILILIFLKPIFYLFHIDVKEALTASYERLENYNADEKDMKSLIEFQKNEIQDKQSAYIEEQMAVQLIDLAKTPLLESYQAAITNIEFSFASEKTPTRKEFEDLEEVIVYIKHAEESEEGVNIVDEVVINTNTPKRNKDSPELEEIENLLRDVWEIENKEVTVIWKGGTT
ncbi:stage III sporulation protein AF [Virgibacillus phasianinus]|uniref:Stage III sporulation protein AF n=1 Tax=Virgibacillus phasianinus TaxID=2017483 RepID=A0A220U5X6_9BACI|nr:stage III sporulation protein AF [Virgibacillus phasianinus]ASK63231.1 stage III sporulation protein AF [Virgibacillus phasianinus]